MKAASTLAASATSALASLRAALQRPWVQRAGFAAAILIFAGGLYLSVRARPDLLNQIAPTPLIVVAGILCPLLLALNAAIVRVTARLGGVAFSAAESLRLTILSSALNHLPLPGGPVMRIAAMKARGGDLVTAGAVTLGAALMWMGFAAGLTGALALLQSPLLGAACLTGAAIALTAGFTCCRRTSATTGDLALLAALSLAVALAYWIALWFGFQALSTPASLTQAGVISGAGVIGSAASFLPAGLGAREAAGAGLAAMIGFDPYIAFAATALVQIAMIACLIVASVLSLALSPQAPPAHPQSPAKAGD